MENNKNKCSILMVCDDNKISACEHELKDQYQILNTIGCATYTIMDPATASNLNLKDGSEMFDLVVYGNSKTQDCCSNINIPHVAIHELVERAKDISFQKYKEFIETCVKRFQNQKEEKEKEMRVLFKKILSLTQEGKKYFDEPLDVVESLMSGQNSSETDHHSGESSSWFGSFGDVGGMAVSFPSEENNYASSSMMRSDIALFVTKCKMTIGMSPEKLFSTIRTAVEGHGLYELTIEYLDKIEKEIHETKPKSCGSLFKSLLKLFSMVIKQVCAFAYLKSDPTPTRSLKEIFVEGKENILGDVKSLKETKKYLEESFDSCENFVDWANIYLRIYSGNGDGLVDELVTLKENGFFKQSSFHSLPRLPLLTSVQEGKIRKLMASFPSNSNFNERIIKGLLFQQLRDEESAIEEFKDAIHYDSKYDRISVYNNVLSSYIEVYSKFEKEMTKTLFDLLSLYHGLDEEIFPFHELFRSCTYVGAAFRLLNKHKLADDILDGTKDLAESSFRILNRYWLSLSPNLEETRKIKEIDDAKKMCDKISEFIWGKDSKDLSSIAPIELTLILQEIKQCIKMKEDPFAALIVAESCRKNGYNQIQDFRDDLQKLDSDILILYYSIVRHPIEGNKLYVWLVDKEIIEHDVIEYKQIEIDNFLTSGTNRSLVDLSKAVIPGKIQKKLVKTTQISRLYIIPQGKIGMIPFAALCIDEKRSLIDICSFSVVGSMKDAIACELNRYSKNVNQMHAGIFGVEKLTNLSYAEKEVKAIKQYAEQYGLTLSCFVDDNCTFETFKEEATKCDYIHIVSHANFEGGDSYYEASGWIDLKSGSLQAKEIAGLNFAEKKPIVVLSVCVGAQGKVTMTSGLLGLASAFLRAGCSSVIAAVAPVKDRETMLMMERFADELFKGNISIADALRNAIIDRTSSGINLENVLSSPPTPKLFFVTGNGYLKLDESTSHSSYTFKLNEIRSKMIHIQKEAKRIHDYVNKIAREAEMLQISIESDNEIKQGISSGLRLFQNGCDETKKFLDTMISNYINLMKSKMNLRSETELISGSTGTNNFDKFNDSLRWSGDTWILVLQNEDFDAAVRSMRYEKYGEDIILNLSDSMTHYDFWNAFTKSEMIPKHHVAKYKEFLRYNSKAMFYIVALDSRTSDMCSYFFTDKTFSMSKDLNDCNHIVAHIVGKGVDIQKHLKLDNIRVNSWWTGFWGNQVSTIEGLAMIDAGACDNFTRLGVFRDETKFTLRYKLFKFLSMNTAKKDHYIIYSGHGSQTGIIVEDGEIPADDLFDYLFIGSNFTRKPCLVLNCCYSLHITAKILDKDVKEVYYEYLKELGLNTDEKMGENEERWKMIEKGNYKDNELDEKIICEWVTPDRQPSFEDKEGRFTIWPLSFGLMKAEGLIQDFLARKKVDMAHIR